MEKNARDNMQVMMISNLVVVLLILGLLLVIQEPVAVGRMLS